MFQNVGQILYVHAAVPLTLNPLSYAANTLVCTQALYTVLYSSAGTKQNRDEYI